MSPHHPEPADGTPAVRMVHGIGEQAPAASS